MWDGLTLTFSSIVGSGVFASPGIVFKHVGSGGAALGVWAVAGFLAYCGAVCYAELAAAVPSAGGEAAFLERGYGRFASFLFTWATAVVCRPSSLAITLVVFGQYVCRMQSGHVCKADAPEALTPALVGLAVTAVVTSSARLTSKALTLSTVVSTLALGLIAVAAVWHVISSKSAESLAETNVDVDNATPHLSHYAPALFAALWAFDGWNTLAYASEELSEPHALANIIKTTMALVTALYLAANAAFVVVLPPRVVAASDTLGVDFGETVAGIPGGLFISLVVACATLGSAVGTLFSSSRLVFSAARGGSLPKVFSMVDSVTETPVNALVCQCLAAAGLMLSGNVEHLVDVFSSSTWVFYLACVVAAWRLRTTEPLLPRPYMAPTYAFAVFIPAACFMLALQTSAAPRSSLMAFALVASGAPVFAWFHISNGINHDEAGGMTSSRPRAWIDACVDAIPCLSALRRRAAYETI